MKKLFVIAMLATVGMAACSKDDTAPAGGPKKYVQVTIPEEMVSGETRTSIDGTTTNWVAGDKVAVLLYDGAATMTCQFTADKSGPTTTFSGDVPIGSYSLAAAYYPYDCNATFDAVNKTFKHTWGPEYCTDNLAAYDFMYTNIWEEPFEINEATTVLHVHFTFKPLMARIKISLGLGANETQESHPGDRQQRNADGRYDRRPGELHGIVRNQFDRSSHEPERVRTGAAPRGHTFDHDREGDDHRRADLLGQSFTLAGLKRNHHYTMSVPCNKKTVTITVPDAIDQKYGTHTYQDNGFYTVDSQYDPEGIFNDWYFYQAEIKSDKNGDDKLKKNRIQLQVPAGFNNANNGAFVTAPIQCEGSKTVKVSFEVATNRIGNIEYRIGVTGNGPITESWLRDRNNILNGNDQKCKSGTQTHTFTVTNGQRLMIKILSTAGSYHVEFADFTYTVE